VRNNLAGMFIKLKRYDDARQEIVRAIGCKKPFGHTAEPWKTWDVTGDCCTHINHSANIRQTSGKNSD